MMKNYIIEFIFIILRHFSRKLRVKLDLFGSFYGSTTWGKWNFEDCREHWAMISIFTF